MYNHSSNDEEGNEGDLRFCGTDLKGIYSWMNGENVFIIFRKKVEGTKLQSIIFCFSRGFEIYSYVLFW